MRNMTIRAVAIRAVLAAVDSKPEPPWGYAKNLDTMLTNEHGEPRLYVSQIVDIVFDVIAEAMQKKEGN